jgi:xanthine dehydrogenase YagS FAD-binding subunit
MQLQEFKNVNAATLDEAISVLAEGNAQVIAGGTDVVSTLRARILRDYPETVVNLKTISPSLDYIREDGGMLHIGALTRIGDIAGSALVHGKWTTLAEAAHKTASPNIREIGTVGGNICQLSRCWYFRKRDNRFDCIRKGGGVCNAVEGDNRYNSIFGDVMGCVCVNASDMAPALIVLGAIIVTTKREIEAEIFWDFATPGSTVLDADEIVTEIKIPEPDSDVKSAFVKFALRKSIDFPVVNCAAAIGGEAARICLNAVYVTPYRSMTAEEAITGKPITEENAEAAGEEAIRDNLPLSMNSWKIQIAKTMVKRAILGCR